MASNPLSTLGTIFVNNENQGTTIVVSDHIQNLNPVIDYEFIYIINVAAYVYILNNNTRAIRFGKDGFY